MRQIMVIVANSNNSKMEVYSCINEEEAKQYIKERYVMEIQNAPYYDFENSYIDKSLKSAKVCAGIYSVKISMCNNIKYVNKNLKRNNKRNGYHKNRKVKHMSNKMIRSELNNVQ